MRQEENSAARIRPFAIGLLVTAACAVASLAAAFVPGVTSAEAAIVSERRVYAPHLGRKMRLGTINKLGRVNASWYGPGFFGNKTACGQRLRKRTFGVAHRTLPCGTLVFLRKHNRQIVVPVIDRGPYAWGIEFDLSQRTKRYLRVKDGHVKVRAAVLVGRCFC